MKKVYSLAIVLLLVICAFFTGCANKGLPENPSLDATVYGNGGIAVIKEDYLYFVNGYDDASKFTSYKVNNVEGKVERGAIYRTKLDANGNVQRDEEGFLLSCERVVSKTVGFDNGGFYIIGDYIYFLTPHMENDGSGTLQNSWLDICKIKIDGSGQIKRLYYTQTKPSNFDWSAVMVNNTPYLIVNDEGKLVSINGNSGNSSVLADKTTSIAMPKFETYEYGNVEDYNKYVYYTRDKVDSDKLSTEFTGNVVCRVNITDKSDKEEYIDNLNIYDKYTVVEYKDGRVYYSKSDSRYSDISQLYKRNVREVAFENAVEIKLTLTSYEDYIILSETDSEQTKIVSVDSNNVVRVISQNGQTQVNPTQKLLFNGNDKEVKLIAVSEEIVYFTIDSKLCTINMYDENQEQNNILNSNKTYKIDVENLISVIDNKVFVLAKYTPAKASDTSSDIYYLNVITTTIDESESSQFLGKFVKNEMPANPNDDLSEDDEPVLPWVK